MTVSIELAEVVYIKNLQYFWDFKSVALNNEAFNYFIYPSNSFKTLSRHTKRSSVVLTSGSKAPEEKQKFNLLININEENYKYTYKYPR